MEGTKHPHTKHDDSLKRLWVRYSLRYGIRKHTYRDHEILPARLSLFFLLLLHELLDEVLVL